MTQCEDKPAGCGSFGAPKVADTPHRNHFIRDCRKMLMDLCKGCLIGSGEAAMESAERQRECVTPDFGLDGSFWEQH